MVPFESIWPQVAPLVAKAERPSRYINHEWGSVYKPEAGFRFCMVYPDTYELGQANQALRILVNAVNARDGMVAERGFLPAPDMCDALRREGLPLFSIESCAPLGAFDVIGITLPHELAATNVLEALDLAGLPLHAVDRSEDDPLVVAGCSRRSIWQVCRFMLSIAQKMTRSSLPVVHVRSTPSRTRRSSMP